MNTLKCVKKALIRTKRDYDDSYYQLPELKVNEVIIETGLKLKESLFVVQAETLDEHRE